MSVSTVERPRRASPPRAEVPAPASPELPLTVIEPPSAWGLLDVRELWRYRELLGFLTLRDIKLRYKQTVLGFAWTVVQPASTVLVFVVFVGWMGGLAAGSDDYTLLVLSGVLPWTFFANATSNAANSLIGNERLVTKTYFPRVMLPAANVGAAAFDFLVCLALLGIVAAVSGVVPTVNLLLAPVVIALLALTAFGVGTLLSALIVAQRDFRYLMTFGVQLWMFATPCIYMNPANIAPAAQRWMPLNPVYGLILNFRAAVLGTEPDFVSLTMSACVAVAAAVVGLAYFRRVERTMADTI